MGLADGRDTAGASAGRAGKGSPPATTGGKVRRSDRVALELPIQVFGDDSAGRGLTEDTHTVLVSRYGAKIFLGHKLVPEQEITIACLRTGKEATARVIGQIEEEEGGATYGVAFLDPEVNLWDIEFPPLSESEKAVGRVLLECARCRTREVTYLNDIEVQVLAASRRVSRSCRRCGGTSLWRVSGEPLEATAGKASGLDVGPAPNPSDPPTAETRPAPATLRLKACIRHPALGEEVVTTEAVSAVGFSFKSSNTTRTICRFRRRFRISPPRATSSLPCASSALSSFPASESRCTSSPIFPCIATGRRSTLNILSSCAPGTYASLILSRRRSAQSEWETVSFGARSKREDRLSRHSYPVSQGLKVILALVVLREKVIQPPLVGIARAKLGRKPKTGAPSLKPFDFNMQSLFQELGVVAQTISVGAGAASGKIVA